MSVVWKPVLSPPSSNSVSGLSSLGTEIYKVMVLEAVNRLQKKENEVCNLKKSKEETAKGCDKFHSSYYYAQTLLDRENEIEMKINEEHINYQVNFNTTKQTNRSWYLENTSSQYEGSISRGGTSLNLNATCDYVNSYLNVLKSPTLFSEMVLFHKNYNEPEVLGSFEQNKIIKTIDYTHQKSRNNPKKLISNNPLRINNNKLFSIVNNKNKKYKQLRIDGFFREKINFNNKKVIALKIKVI